MKKISAYITKILLKLVALLNKKEPVQIVQSINKQDIDLITKAFPPFVYRKGMTSEEIGLETIKCWGEQRVLSFILARIEGRIGLGVTYD